VYRECTASFEPKLWNKVIWRSWERTTKTISSRTGKIRRLALHRGIPDQRLVRLVGERGITFQVDPRGPLKTRSCC
jgi:hypothetical protein